MNLIKTILNYVYQDLAPNVREESSALTFHMIRAQDFGEALICVDENCHRSEEYTKTIINTFKTLLTNGVNASPEIKNSRSSKLIAKRLKTLSFEELEDFQQCNNTTPRSGDA